MKYDLWIDYHRVDTDGLTHAHVRNAVDATKITAGAYVIVGAEDAESAVAHVVDIDSSGVVLVRVLPGPAEAHLELIGPRPA